jgi:hypothetical protein
MPTNQLHAVRIRVSIHHLPLASPPTEKTQAQLTARTGVLQHKVFVWSPFSEPMQLILNEMHHKTYHLLNNSLPF